MVHETLKQKLQKDWLLDEIASNFSVQVNYPPKAALWCTGLLMDWTCLDVDVGQANWKKLATWAGQEFGRQLAYVASNNAALMDPVSMIMAACVGERLRK